MTEFEESVIEIHKCPKCGGRVERRIARETQQKEGGQWYVESCETCGYWFCGWT